MTTAMSEHTMDLSDLEDHTEAVYERFLFLREHGDDVAATSAAWEAYLAAVAASDVAWAAAQQEVVS